MSEMQDGVGVSRWRVGDRVTVRRGECDYWGHDSQWAPNGTRGTVEGSWAGHPGGDGEHHVSVSFKDGHVEVANLIFKTDELELVRRARRHTGTSGMRRPSEVPALGHALPERTGENG